MQTHHEHFIVSAKGFFHINLDLLGSVSDQNFMRIEIFLKFHFDFQMLVACTTFLVILIQFEASNKEIQSMTSEMESG